MDTERAIEHLLELHARAEVRMDRMDRQIGGIQKLVRTGMKLIVRIEKTQAELQRSQAEVQRSRSRTDAKIDKLIGLWLKRPPNGKSGR